MKLENKKSKEDYDKLVDASIKQTLFRSINTTITTMLPIITLLLFGAREIFEFNIAILFGLIAGAYSSVFLSAQIWRRIELRPKKEKKTTKKDNKKNNKKNGKKDKKQPEELLVKGINS